MISLSFANNKYQLNWPVLWKRYCDPFLGQQRSCQNWNRIQIFRRQIFLFFLSQPIFSRMHRRHEIWPDLKEGSGSLESWTRSRNMMLLKLKKSLQMAMHTLPHPVSFNVFFKVFPPPNFGASRDNKSLPALAEGSGKRLHLDLAPNVCHCKCKSKDRGKCKLKRKKQAKCPTLYQMH